MSASTVSVTAKSRRRPSAVTDGKQSLDLVNEATISPIFDTKTGAGDGGDDSKVNSGNKDLSHSIRGEAILERSKDKKSSQLPNSNVPVRTRNRKVLTSKTPKPRWQTVLSIMTKNLLLLFVLVGLVQVVRKFVANSGNNLGGLMAFSDMESRIAGVESSLKTTSKMLQVQVEVVDKKIESEVGNLRREMNKKIEDKTGEIDKQLGKLEEKSERLEMSLVELSSKELLTKDDLARLYDELKKGEGNLDGGGLSLDEIRGLAREIVDKEIEKHAADGLARVDFALASGGARVLSHSEPLFSPKFGGWGIGNSMTRLSNDATKMLMPSFGEPGHCFALKGSRGYVVIKLRATIVPEAITLEHVAESVAYDRSSAPKHCRVSGFLVGDRSLEIHDNLKNFTLADFIYDLDKSHAQTFDVLDEAKYSVIDAVLFEFDSNYGSSTHTCIYRLRVHGQEAKSVPVVPADS